MMKHYVRLACFVGGALFGSAGVKLLTSKDAKNAYIHITAAGLRMKDSVMETVTAVQENAADIVASAKDINEARASLMSLAEATMSAAFSWTAVTVSITLSFIRRPAAVMWM